MKIFSLLLLLSVLTWAKDFVDKDIKTFLVKSHKPSISDTSLILENGESVDFPYLKFNSSGDSIITSRTIEITGGGGDINLSGWIKNTSGTQNVEVFLGVLLSPEVGIFWHSLGTFNSDTTFVYAYQDQGFANEMSNQFLIKIIQTGAQNNIVALRVRKYQAK